MHGAEKDSRLIYFSDHFEEPDKKNLKVSLPCECEDMPNKKLWARVIQTGDSAEYEHMRSIFKKMEKAQEAIDFLDQMMAEGIVDKDFFKNRYVCSLKMPRNAAGNLAGVNYENKSEEILGDSVNNYDSEGAI